MVDITTWFMSRTSYLIVYAMPGCVEDLMGLVVSWWPSLAVFGADTRTDRSRTRILATTDSCKADVMQLLFYYVIISYLARSMCSSTIIIIFCNLISALLAL